jgi:elongation factor Ts
MKPAYISQSDIPEEMKEKAKELFMKEVAGSDKPEEIKQKMLQGKIDAYFKEQTLLDQSFIKNPETTVAGLLQKAGQDVKINMFTRVSLV